jgi:nucleotide-binding universal stress UspA family protein
MSAQVGTSTHTIVAGVDGSDSSIDALRWAFAEAERTGADLEAITAWQWPLTLGAVAPFAPEYDPAGDAQRMLADIVASVAGEFPTVTVRTRSVEGHPSEVLVEASRHAVLLVVGSRGHGAFAGAVLGSVSQHCVAHAASPVLVHRHHR